MNHTLGEDLARARPTEEEGLAAREWDTMPPASDGLLNGEPAALVSKGRFWFFWGKSSAEKAVTRALCIRVLVLEARVRELELKAMQQPTRAK